MDWVCEGTRPVKPQNLPNDNCWGELSSWARKKASRKGSCREQVVKRGRASSFSSVQ